MTDQDTASPPAKPEREAAEDGRRVVCAVELGWRIAYLHADLKHPIHDAPPVTVVPRCLPAAETLPNGDQVELHVRAAASLARRLGLDAHAKRIADLARAASVAATDRDQCDAVLEQLRARDMALIKDLWASREGEGKAYELGSSLFDTWDRLRLASARGHDEMRQEWAEVFGEGRVERIKLLLDDLQTRLDPAAVTVVKDHLDCWHERVHDALRANPEELPCGKAAVAQIRSQALIWRQLVTRDKEPEAYLQPLHRAAVRHEFNRLMWRSLRRPLPIACAIACLAVVAAMVAGGGTAATIQKALLPILGAIGLTQASLIVVARERLRVWSELLWNRAIAKVVCEVTCRTDELFPARRRHAHGVPRAATVVARRLRTAYARPVRPAASTAEI